MNVLVTGGLGYIGSHTTVELLEEGHSVVVVDDLSNSREIIKEKIEDISGRKIKFYKYNLLDSKMIEKIFEENKIESVIHFAAFKAVGESVEKPLKYYSNNIIGLLNILQIMSKFNVRNFVFSSSATVYGESKIIPINEKCSLTFTNPYGGTKLMGEDILRDLYKSDKSWNIAILRYFNPVGAHESGLIGESPKGIPNNIMPYITKVAVGDLPQLSIFGGDYDTIDGTGVRDYIHVVDLAIGHIRALEKLSSNSGLVTYNLGTGKGYSVLELLKAFSEVSKKDIKYKIVERRAGDVAICYADPTKANIELGWVARKSITDMCRDSWNWQVKSLESFK